MSTLPIFKAAAAMTLCLAFAASVQAGSTQPKQVDFSGQTVAIDIGYGPGGGYDTYARAFAAHFGDHLPGKPRVVARNMPGAGGLVVANYIYSDAPKDGTQLGAFASSTALQPLMGDPSARFDPSAFSWIGSMSQDVSFCGVWSRPNAPTSFDQLFQRQAIFGSSGGASTSQLHPLILRNVLHAKIKVIPGYDGTKATNLAMQRGEIDGACSLFVTSIHAQYMTDVQQGRLKLIIQMGPSKTNEFGPVPSVYDYIKDPRDKQIFDLFFKQLLLARPIVGPPGMSKERVAVLRKAFMETMADPKFLADAKTINISIDPTDGQRAEALLKEFVSYPPDVIRRAQAAIRN